MTPTLRLRAGAYVAFLALVGAVLWFGVRPSLKLETDLLALLPAAEHNPATEHALREVSALLGERVTFLVGAADFAAARAGADAFAAALGESGAFGDVQLAIDDRLMSHELYGPWLPGLVSDRHLRLLRDGATGALKQEALRALYAPLPMPAALPAAQDPLGLANGFLLQRLPAGSKTLPRDGVLAVEADGLHYVFMTATLSGGAFASAAQDRALDAIARAESAARDAAKAELQVLRAGLLFHSAAATRSSEREIELITTVSLVAVAALVLLTFGSLRPLLLTMFSVAAGTLTGFVACHTLFGSVHLLTLVFGSTLIGVAVDYSNYYLHDAFDDFDGWTQERALRNTARGILLGLATAALGYLALTLAPFPGLRQMAVFSAVGLAGAAGCVLCLYPLLARKPRNPRPVILDVVLALYRGLAPLRRARWAGIVAAVALAAGIVRLQAQDDVRQLQASPPHIVAEEIRLRGLIGNPVDSRFYLVRGATPEDVLQAEEALREKLDAAIGQGVLASYVASSRAIPSQQRQREMRELLQRRVYGADGLLAGLMRELGFEPAAIAGRQQAFAALPPDGLTHAAWLEDPSAQPLRPLWLAIPEGSASIVMLSGVRDVEALHAITVPDALLVDKVRDISGVLGKYRAIATRLLVLAYAGAGLLLLWRYGLRAGLPLVAGTWGAALLTLGAFGWLGIGLNLFNTLALLLVLGIGIDYVIFLHEGRGAGNGPLLAVQLSAVTTLLSFGLLAFSATPFIQSLGLTLLMGISWAFLFALASATLKDSPQ